MPSASRVLPSFVRGLLGLTLLVVLAALVVWTAPNRWGAGIALHYLSRVYWPDPADPFPPLPETGSETDRV